MSRATSSAELVCVSVVSGTRRVDLVLPAAVPVAELVPELARSVGLLDAATVHAGYQLRTRDGRCLAGDAGLAPQGVEDGGLLVVTAGVAAEPRRLYDDVVEAMADAVERELRPCEPAAGRRTALAAAVLLLGLGAVSLLLQAGSPRAGFTAAVVATLLVTGAVVLSRVQQDPEAAVAVAWTGAGYAAVAGLLLTPGSDRAAAPVLSGPPVAATGAALVAVGAVALVGIGRGRALLLPAAVLGTVLLTGGLAVDAASLRPAPVFTGALVVAVAAGSALPRWALGVTSTRADPVVTTAGTTPEPAEVDPVRIDADARVAHEIMLAMTATVGLLLVLAVPLAVSLGLAGTVLAVACCAVLMLRTRQFRAGALARVGLVSGLAGLAAVAVAVLVLHPDWRGATAAVLAVAGVLSMGGALLPGGVSVHRARLGDVAESLALLSLLPLLALAAGLVGAVPG